MGGKKVKTKAQKEKEWGLEGETNEENILTCGTISSSLTHVILVPKGESAEKLFEEIMTEIPDLIFKIYIFTK